uniref:Putative CyP450 monooxygenase n=1 Tax=Pleurotus sapidus TaxID=98349 RepID=Q2WCN3_PLESI|nr:putative CyP450 monooxygenase [Pleurotus sapidus]
MASQNMYAIGLSSLAIAALLVVVRHYANKRLSLPFPPGPKPLPVLGNVLDIPSKAPWKTYNDWFKVYGDMIYMNTMGQSILVLGSVERITDLLEKRSVKYSDRPRMTMLNELMGWDWCFGLMPYCTSWRKQRKLFYDQFQTNFLQFRPIQINHTHKFLGNLLESPDNFLQHIRLFFAGTILEVTYGIQVSSYNDPYVTNAEQCLAALASASIPGAFLVDTFPILKHIPLWFPGAGFKRKAKEWAKLSYNLVHGPFNATKEALRQGKALPSAAANMLEAAPEDKPDNYEELVRNCAAISFAAGSDTTVSTLQTFFLAMAMFPEAQKEAQAEIDAIVGHTRFPSFADRPVLPYLEALIMEISRWNTVSPLALPHAFTSDDEYDGYFIPKGTIVMANTWALLNDPSVYPNPGDFNPDRFLMDGKINPEVRDPRDFVFGYGRRACPGRFFSQDNLYSAVTGILASFSITPAQDAQGNDIPLKAEMSNGSLSYPLPFKCKITPRTGYAEQLIRHSNSS